MDWRDALDEMEYRERLLTPWEVEFIESMRSWSGHPTERQAAVLVNLAERLNIDIDDLD